LPALRRQATRSAIASAELHASAAQLAFCRCQYAGFHFLSFRSVMPQILRMIFATRYFHAIFAFFAGYAFISIFRALADIFAISIFA
jgi:hypothetical protein